MTAEQRIFLRQVAIDSPFNHPETPISANPNLWNSEIVLIIATNFDIFQRSVLSPLSNFMANTEIQLQNEGIFLSSGYSPQKGGFSGIRAKLSLCDVVFCLGCFFFFVIWLQFWFEFVLWVCGRLEFQFFFCCVLTCRW